MSKGRAWAGKYTNSIKNLNPCEAVLGPKINIKPMFNWNPLKLSKLDAMIKSPKTHNLSSH